jgi:hypothetical protein
MLLVLALIARVQAFPDSLGYEDEFLDIVRLWRPEK